MLKNHEMHTSGTLSSVATGSIPALSCDTDQNNKKSTRIYRKSNLQLSYLLDKVNCKKEFVAYFHKKFGEVLHNTLLP